MNKNKGENVKNALSLMPSEKIEHTILFIRGEKVMLDQDLAKLYGVPTKALNQAIKRNMERFPADLMFQLTASEKKQVVTNCDHLNKLRFSPVLPYAFTEHGAIMVANVLNSKRAVEVSIYIVRAFVNLRRAIDSHREVAIKLNALERKLEKHDSEIHSLFAAIRQMIIPPEKPRRRFGF